MSISRLTYTLATAGGLPVLRWPALDATGAVDAVVTTRHGGVSNGPYRSLNLGLHVGDESASVIENRTRAAAAVGLDLDALVFCKQAHGRVVAHVTSGDRGQGSRSDEQAIPGTDALVTTDSDVALAVMVADCVPIVMVDPMAHVLAGVHAGWQGTTERVTEAAVQHMLKHGADASRVVVGVGPAIAGDRYQVGDNVMEAASEAFGDRVDLVVRPDGTGRWLFDLRAANRLILADNGINPGNIHVADIDSGTDDFFSDRLVRPCGRFAAIARLRP